MPSNQDLGRSIRRLHWLHHREGNRRVASRAGLSLVQWEVLHQVSTHPDASLRALAEATLQTDQSMGELAKRMVDRGLLERTADGGRAVRHKLTKDGRAAYKACSGIVDELLAETVGTLTARERAELYRLVEKAQAGLRLG